MFCEVLPDSWTKGFYKREGKSNVERGWLRGKKLEKRTGERYHSGCSDYVFYYIYNYV
jgi:hypothetical protein